MADWKQIIKEWLSEFSSLQPNEIKSFASEHEHNHEITTAIFNLYISDYELQTASLISEEVDYNKEIIEEVCTQLFNFYRTQEVELKRFSLQFVPTLIFHYLSLNAQGKECRCLETLLIAIYNFEVVDEEGKPKVVSFRLPSLAQPSIYHEPLSLGPQYLTESALRRWEDCNTKLVKWGPHQQIEAITPKSRLKVMAVLMFVNNEQSCYIQKFALKYFCTAASGIVTQGFSKNKDSTKLLPRIPVSSKFLLELVEGTYYAMFNEFYGLAYEVMNDINERAQYELLPDVMAVSSAILHSLEKNTESSEDPLGISVALSPTTNSTNLSKSMITNASFRTKKLPDDLPIQAGQVPNDPNDALQSITEEGETDSAPMQRGASGRLSRPKLSGFMAKKTKDNKEKKVTVKEATKTMWSSMSGGGDMVDSAKSGEPEAKDDTVSMASCFNTENSDSRSQATTDSSEMDTNVRFAAMQVTSV